MKIDYLHTVTLNISTGAEPSESGPSTLKPGQLNFVFGVASGGLSPFEHAIHNKSAGDSLQLSIPVKQGPEYFAHLYKQLCSQLPLGIVPDVFDLAVSVASVVKSDEKDVVKAMAQSIGHGCGGGSCDCGCS